MSPENSVQSSIRQSTAIAVWLLLSFLLAVVEPDDSTGAALGVVVLVSILNAFALSIVDPKQCTQSDSPMGGRGTPALRKPPKSSSNIADNHFAASTRQRLVGIFCSSGITLGWVLRLGISREPLQIAALLVVALVPLAFVSLATPSRWRVQLHPQRRLSSRIRPELAESPVAEAVSSFESNPILVMHEADPLEAEESCTEEFCHEWKSPDSPDVTQWLTRSVTGDGEIIEGGVRLDFVAGQRDGIVHISFCPPFRSTPDVTTEDLDGAGVEIRVAAAFPFGARLSVRRSADPKAGGNRPSAASCRIGFVASSTAAERAA